MNIRHYNVYFHTHTISGIIICAILYVMFFAGSFTFFRKEMSAWQKGRSNVVVQQDAKDFNALIDSLGGKYKLQGRDFSFYLQPNSTQGYVSMSVSKDTTVSKVDPGKKQEKRGRRNRDSEDSADFQYDFKTRSSADYSQSYDMGEFFYRLHFLAQLNQVPIKLGVPFGYLLAGIVSFLFLFALITGLLLHWDKLVTNFFVFRPWNKWKTVWTDMHTALGVIGYPFQFMYAVTGIILIFNAALVMPFTKLLYNGDSEKMYEDLGYSDNSKFEYLYQPLNEEIDVNSYVAAIEKRWPKSVMTRIHIKNYGDANMYVLVEANPQANTNFAGSGKLSYRVKNDKVVAEKSPEVGSTYIDRVKGLVYHLHFGDFGGYPVKVVFFVLGIMGCVVIISGILIWLVARNKSNVPAYKRKFNFWASNVFIAICLSMFPVTAATLIVVKIYPAADQSFIYAMYFYSWLALSAFYIVRRNLRTTNRETLLLGSILGFCIPIVNGVVSGNWVWTTFTNRHTDILFFDLLWISIAVIGMVALIKVRKDDRTVSK